MKRGSKRAKSREQNELGLKLVIDDVRKLLDQIEDAVPLINLAITTSGVNLSTNLPATVSPSRLLQASTFLTTADSMYAGNSGNFVQVGPAYTLSMYMLFASHASRPHDEESIRTTTWKEVIHKARVKLVRVPIDSLYLLPGDHHEPRKSEDGYFPQSFPEDATSAEFAYQLMIAEDLDDGRVHTFEEDEPQPGPFNDLLLAGIRDVVPIHQVSKIFYADTGKILNIGTEGETNNPVLLLKRDVHAEPPRRMMERRQSAELNLDEEDEDDASDYGSQANSAEESTDQQDESSSESTIDEQSELDAQFMRESISNTPADEEPPDQSSDHSSEGLLEQPSDHPPNQTLKQSENSSAHWRLPIDLDPEWIAFEVYTEEPETDDDEDLEPPSHRPQSSRTVSLGPEISKAFANLNINSPATLNSTLQAPSPAQSILAPSGPVKTSLSLLEMLIRLTALQQFRQSSHLTIEDELLNFFLEDNATTGAGSNAEYRQRIRRDARRRVGFDPYDESPIKRRGEEYLSHPRSAAENWDDTRSVREGSYFDGETRLESPPVFARQSVEYPHYDRSSSLGHRLPSTPSSPSPAMRPSAVSVRSSPASVRSASSRQTPPSWSAKGRRALLRGLGERKVRSPLTKEVQVTSGGDSALGTSPPEVEGGGGEDGEGQ